MANDQPVPVPVPSLPSRFRLRRLLGHGGQADVWLAHDEELGEDVAVKVGRPGLLRCTLAEEVLCDERKR